MSSVKYKQALEQQPPGGVGENGHTHLLSSANLGLKAGVPPEQIFEDIKNSIPAGKRQITDKEIRDTIKTALGDFGAFVPKFKPDPVTKNGHEAFKRITATATIRDEAALMASSPVPLNKDPGDPEIYKAFFENLFEPNDLIFIGDRPETGVVGENIRRALDWLVDLWNGEKAGPFIIPNPLTGQSAPKESGDGETCRGNNNVKIFRFAIAEFDTISREDQIAFWSSVKLPIMALIDSGGKSIHAWIDVQELARIETKEDWKNSIEDRLYHQMLIPLGIDAACKNPARLSRLPGYFRKETGHFQRLLWLRGRENG